MAEYKADYHFSPVPLALLEDPEIKADQLAAYAAIRSFCTWGKDTGARVSDDRAAGRAGMSVRSFGRARQALRTQGWLDWKRTGRTNSYLVRSAKLAEQKHQKRRAEDGGSDTPAEQNGQPGGTERPHSPSDITRAQGNEKETKRRVRAAGSDTWLTPFMDVHRDLAGGRFQAKKWAKLFRDLADDWTQQEIVQAQRAYLRDLVGRGALQYLNYATMASQLGYWLGRDTAAAAPKPGRLTTSTKGKDFLA